MFGGFASLKLSSSVSLSLKGKGELWFPKENLYEGH